MAYRTEKKTQSHKRTMARIGSAVLIIQIVVKRETGPLQTKNVACDFSIIRDSDV